MTRNLIIGLIGIIILSSSCSSSLRIANSTAKTSDIVSTGVYHKPVIADLDVSDQKVEAEVISQNYDEQLKDLKQKAIVKALKSVEGDVLVEPKYQIVTIGNKKTVRVTGYPASYKNFRNATNEDMELLVVENGANIETQEIEDQEVKTGKAVVWVLVGLGTLAALGLLF